MIDEKSKNALEDATRTITYVRIDPVTGGLTSDRMTINSEE